MSEHIRKFGDRGQQPSFGKMANTFVFSVLVRNMLNNSRLTRYIGEKFVRPCIFVVLKREYSVFPKSYIKPIFRKDEQEALFKSEEAEVVTHQPIRPALSSDTSSVFYDRRVLKFTNMILKNGNKVLASSLVSKAFEGVKRIQLQRYHKAINKEDKEKIELDPYVIFHQAVDNCMPVLQLLPCKKGGITYQIPVPITQSKSQFQSMKWLIQAANEKEDEERFYNILAKELVAASQHQGRAIKWKEELHKKCQNNRAYAHFRWM